MIVMLKDAYMHRGLWFAITVHAGILVGKDEHSKRGGCVDLFSNLFEGHSFCKQGT